MNIELKDVSVTTIAAIIGALLMLGGVKVTDTDVYVCEDRGIGMPCEDLTKYYGLPNGKCINSELGNKLCRSGWTDKFRDFEPEEETIETLEPTDKILVDANGKEWSCETDNGKVWSYSRCASGIHSGYLGEFI